MMNKMILIPVIAFLYYVTSYGDDASGAWGPEVAGYQMSVEVSRSSFGCSEPIILQITLKNRESTPGRIVTTQIPEIDYPATVLMPTETWLPFRLRAPFTELGLKRTDGRRVISRAGFSLPPGGEFKSQMVISDLYYMRSPGEYSVLLSREVLKRDGTGRQTLTSNRLNITVEPCKH